MKLQLGRIDCYWAESGTFLMFSPDMGDHWYVIDTGRPFSKESPCVASFQNSEDAIEFMERSTPVILPMGKRNA